MKEFAPIFVITLMKPLTLDTLGKQFHISPSHLQRSFKQEMGISPRQYTDACRIEKFKDRLRKGVEITQAIYESGYGSSSRLYEKSDDYLGMTPTDFRNGGQGVEIHYSIVASPLGNLLVAATFRGICAVHLGETPDELQGTLHKLFPKAEFYQNDEALSDWVKAIVDYLEGCQPNLDLPLDIQATAFQKRVWEELKYIPYGETRSYQEIANAIDHPKAVRAVANAIGKNPTALIIPCHRVVRSDGNLGGYRWGIHRKDAILKMEQKQ